MNIEMKDWKDDLFLWAVFQLKLFGLPLVINLNLLPCLHDSPGDWASQQSQGHKCKKLEEARYFLSAFEVLQGPNYALAQMMRHMAGICCILFCMSENLQVVQQKSITAVNSIV